MKKLVYTTLGLLATSVAFAQMSKVHTPIPKGIKTVTKKSKPISSAYGKANLSDWYNVLQFAEASPIGGAIETYVGFMYHDSLAKIRYADGGSAYNQWIGAGAVIDPTDPAIENTNNPAIRLSRYVSYRADSVRFSYVYVRNNDSIDDGMGGKLAVVDTLYVIYYKGNQLGLYSFTASGERLSMPNPDNWIGGDVRFPSSSSVFKIDTLLLTREDSTIVNTDANGAETGFQIKSKVLKTPAGFAINDAKGADSVFRYVGCALIFKAGLPTISGTDTAVMYYGGDPLTPPARRANYFGFYYGINNAGDWSQQEAYTTSLLVPKWAAYAPSAPTNGWSGFVSGNAFVADFFVDMDFYLTTTSDNIGLNKINEGLAMTNVYPNPAPVNSKAVMGFNLKQSSNVKVTIVNLVGQEVRTVVNKNFAAGEQAIDIDLTGLNAGVYFVNMTANGISETRKLTIGQ